ncbi:hypothetical protein [Chromobacterium phragmitis]|uniref:hypothetical protein n=1 Tax=Chromobacterium phragmitis TaxID=2202141 RepID=UPI0018E065FC|nr:hypothetical protein [Chromobacterium phragmitis]
MDQSTTGLYPKFHVSRADGRDQPGGDRAGADYLVMDLAYDEHAVPAALAYADSCRERYPQLADDIVAQLAHRQATADQQEGVGSVCSADAPLGNTWPAIKAGGAQ